MMKKRITAFLVMLVMLMTSISVTYAENAEETAPIAETPVEVLDTEEFNALYAMGFVGDELLNTDKNTLITRAQFTGWLFKLSGYTLTEYKASEIPFRDVSIVTPYYNEICTMYQMGIVNGTDPEMFSPNAHVTYAQACKLIIDVLGYRQYAEIKYGEYPEGYVMMAGELEINDGVKDVKWNTELTAENAVTMLYNAGLAEVLAFSGTDKNGNPTYDTDGTTLFAKGNDIYEAKGVMQSNGIASIVAGEAQDGITVIDGTNYVSADVDLTGFLGMSVKYFYRDDKITKKLLWATPDTRINRVLDIEAEDLILTSPQYSLTNIVYYDANGKEESAKLKRMVDVIYNNSFCAVPTLDLMKIETGKMRLIDNNDDEIYDTVVVEEYKNIFVNATIPDTNTIADKYNYTLNLNSYQTAKIIKDGKVVDINAIGKGELLSYVENIEKTKIFIYAPNTKFTGTVKSVSKVRNRDVYNFDSASYRLSNTYKALMDSSEFVTVSPKPGKEYTFWLDMGGEIAEIEESSGNMQYALLMSTRVGEVYEDSDVYVRLLMPNDTKITGEIDKKIVINGQREDASEVIARSKDAAGNHRVQVVKVAFSEDGTLRQIDFATNNTNRDPLTGGNLYGYNAKDFTLDYENSATSVVSDGFLMMNNRYYVEGSSVVFMKLAIDEPEPYIARSKSSMSHGTYYTQVYDVGADMVAAAVYREGHTTSSAYIGDESPMIVESVEWVYDKDTDQEVKQITGYVAGKKRTLPERTPGVIPDTIKTGDVVRLGHYDSKITSVTMELSRTEIENKASKVVTSSISGERAVVFGKLYTASNSGITIITPDAATRDSYGELISFGYRTGEVVVTIFDLETEEITIGDIHDVYQMYSPNENGELPDADDLSMVYARIRYTSGLSEVILFRY